jgi:GNAT superfamily N-acetyltransferase
VDAIITLRAEAWKGRGVRCPGDETWQDGQDAHARHWIVREDGHLIAAARMCVHSSLEHVPDSHLYAALDGHARPPIASINRLVVAPTYRGRGLARVLTDARIVAARKAGCRSVVGNVLDATGPERLRCLIAMGFRPLGHRVFAEAWPFGGVTIVVLDV